MSVDEDQRRMHVRNDEAAKLFRIEDTERIVADTTIDNYEDT